LAYWGEKEIYIPAGAGIAQVLFSSLINDGSYGDGKYQGQADQPVGARFK
jgi:dCTP deaminase